MGSLTVVGFGAQIFHDISGVSMNAPVNSALDLESTSFHDALENGNLPY